MNQQNTSDGNKNKITQSFGKKINIKIIISAVAVIIVLFLIVIVTVIVNLVKVKNAESEYADLVAEYNEEVEAYNEIADEYNDLISGLHDRSVSVNGAAEVNHKDMLEYDFKAFREKDAYSSILNDIKSIKTETVGLQSQYEQIETEKYNELIDLYNSETQKFNSLISRFSNYESINLPDVKIEKEKINQAESSWNRVGAYFTDFDNLSNEIEGIRSEYYELCLNVYNDSILDYNILVDAYNEAVCNTSIDFISGLREKAEYKAKSTDDKIRGMTDDIICKSIEKIIDDTEDLAADYLVVTQITCPKELFVRERLRKVSNIVGISAVTLNNDPNGLLGKDGGYVSCIYFTVKEIDPSLSGKEIVATGTDGGGAIEVYESLEDALNRCDYLSQFDGTLLYSGSYAVVGTMVIRTSYKLSNEQQVSLTDEIVQSMTELEF